MKKLIGLIFVSFTIMLCMIFAFRWEEFLMLGEINAVQEEFIEKVINVPEVDEVLNNSTLSKVEKLNNLRDKKQIKASLIVLGSKSLSQESSCELLSELITAQNKPEIVEALLNTSTFKELKCPNYSAWFNDVLIKSRTSELNLFNRLRKHGIDSEPAKNMAKIIDLEIDDSLQKL